MEVKVNKGLDKPIEITFGDKAVSISLEEAECLVQEIEDSIEECALEKASEVTRKMTEYIHSKGCRWVRAREMAEELQEIHRKNSPTINLEEYYRERRKKEGL